MAKKQRIPDGMPAAVMPERIDEYHRFLSKLAHLGPAEVAAKFGEPRPVLVAPDAAIRNVADIPVQQVGRVAVVPMAGMIVKSPSFLTRYGYASSTEQFVAANQELVGDASVSAIVWECNSPGGSCSGVQEAASKLMALRGSKPIVAISQYCMASAAYWLCCAADKIAAAPSSLTGSIGVVKAHLDQSKANEMAGYKITYIYAGKYKVEGNPDEPLSDSAKANAQAIVDDYYSQFVNGVAEARNVNPKAVREGYGQGAVLTSGRSVAAGLADYVATMDAVLKNLGANSADVKKSNSYQHSQARQRFAESD